MEKTPRIISLKISNFKSFYSEKEIFFAVPNGKKGSGLTILVGPNNSGKSTVIDAITRFYNSNNTNFDKFERHENKKVLFVLKNNKNQVKKLESVKSGSVIQVSDINQNVYPENSNKIEVISSRRHWNSNFGNGYIDKNSYTSNALQQYRYYKNNPDQEFGRRLADISRKKQQKNKFNKLIKIIIPNFTDWQIESFNGQGYVEYITGKKEHHNADFSGDGMIGLFKIVSYLIDSNKNTILIIDEPELSLHPQAQKNLSYLLAKESSKRQIILATHSQYFIDWQSINNGAEIIRFNKPNDIETIPSRLSIKSKQELINLTSDFHKLYLLDLVAKEFFFSLKLLFVEGQEDVALIKKFAEENNIVLNFDIFGYGVGGAENIPKFLRITNELGIKSAAIFDGDKDSLCKECKKEFGKKNKIIKLVAEDIRYKKSDKCKKCKEIIKKEKKGIFNNKGEIYPKYKDYLKNTLNKLNKYFE